MPKRAVAAVLALVIGVAVGAFVLTSEEEVHHPAPSPSSALEEEGPKERPRPAAVAEDRRGANGMPIEEGVPIKEAGWAEHDYEQPLGDGAAWQGERAEAHRDWVERTGAALDIYADREQLSPEEFRELNGAISMMQKEIALTRQRIESGELHPIQGRAEITAARETCESQVTDLFGEEETTAFRLEMMKRVPGGVI